MSNGFQEPAIQAGITQHEYCCYPTGPFTISEPRDQETGGLYVVQERCATDFEAPKL